MCEALAKVNTQTSRVSNLQPSPPFSQAHPLPSPKKNIQQKLHILKGELSKFFCLLNDICTHTHTETLEEMRGKLFASKHFH